MARKKRTTIEWFPEATQIFRIGFSDHQELIDAKTTLDPTGAPTVDAYQLQTEFPEDWGSPLVNITISAVAVVDDIDTDGNVLLKDGAVQFTLGSEGSPPFVDPKPGDNYSIFIMADRLDDPTLQVAGRVWLSIKA